MVRIIFNEEDITIHVDKVRISDYVGLIYLGKKYYIVRKSPNKYILLNLLNTDISVKTEYNNPQEILKILCIKDSFVFDTREELKNWLIKE